MANSNLISEKLEQLKVCDEILRKVPTTKEALLKRCQIFLALRLHSKALVTSDLILETDPIDLRAITYKTKALFSLGRYSDSISIISKTIRTLKGSNVSNNLHYNHKDRHLKILNNLLKEATCLLNQQTNGIYDMSSFLPNRRVKFDNVAEFVGPIEIGAIIAGKGRGVVAKEDIAPGQLILTSRAFEIVFDDDDDDDWNLEIAISQRLTFDPELGDELYLLHAGKTLGYLEPGQGSKRVDLDRITGICTMNSFGNSQNSLGYGHDSRGLWIGPSYINHDCIDFNCIWKVLGDFLFVRTTKEIKAGEEILISYTDSAEPLSERLKFFEAHDFVCECRLCTFQRDQDSKSPEAKTRRDSILNSVEELSKSALFQVKDDPEPDFKEGAKDAEDMIRVLETYLKEIEEIGSGKAEWNLSLHFILDLLSKLYYQIGNKDKYIEMAERYYHLVNGPDGPHLEVGAAGQVATYFLKSGNYSGALKWINTLKKDLRLVYGDSNVFKLLYPILFAEATNCGLEL